MNKTITLGEIWEALREAEATDLVFGNEKAPMNSEPKVIIKSIIKSALRFKRKSKMYSNELSESKRGNLALSKRLVREIIAHENRIAREEE